MRPTISVKSFPGTPFSSSFFLFSSQTHSNGHFFLLLHSFSFFSSSQKHQIYFIKKKKKKWVSLPPIIPQTCSSTRPQKWENGFHTHKHVHPHGHKTSSSMAATLSLAAVASPKPHSINPASSNRLNDQLGRAPDLMIDSTEQRKAPLEHDRGGGRVGWPSGYRSHT